MLKKTLKNFKKLPESNKSMVYLMWIYWFWTIVSMIFVNIYIYKLNESLSNLITYNIVFFTTVVIWFTFIWYLMSVFKKNVKNLYYFSYFFLILAFILLLLFWDNLLWIYMFWSFYGFWVWTFRSAIHTYELSNIKDSHRDFYSSMVSFWENCLEILTPFIISLVFILSRYYDFNWYYILFFITPLIYVTSFFFINQIDNYIPNKISKKDLKNFFNLRKYIFWHLFFFFWWIQQWLYTFLFAILSLYMLKNEVNIWIFQWILWIISISLIIFFSLKRNWDNRFKFFAILSFSYFLICILLVLNFNIVGYIIFSLFSILIKPLYNVSKHVYDLSLMDNIKTCENDFFPAMLFRDFVQYLWRLVALFSFLYISLNYNFSFEKILKIWLFSIGLLYIILVWSIFLWRKYEEKINKKIEEACNKNII